MKKTNPSAYEVRLFATCEKEDNDEVIETYNYDKYEDAFLAYQNNIKQYSTLHGKWVRVDFYDTINDTIISSDYQISDDIPKGSIILTCANEKYMGYAYDMLEVRTTLFRETYADLHPSLDYVSAPFDIVYNNFSELVNDYEEGRYPFNKIASGRQIVEDYIISQENLLQQ